MKVLLINTSAPQCDLGLAKAKNWWEAPGALVVESSILPELFLSDFDVVWLSSIFS
jgi:hypothetical protein